MRRKSEPASLLAVDPEGLGALVEEHLEWMRSRNYSEATLVNRAAYLRRFLVWCQDRGLTRPAEVTKPILERYQRSLYLNRRHDGRPTSFRSQVTHFTAVRTFFRFLARSNRLPSNPAADIELPKVEHRLPRAVLTAAEAERVLAQADVRDPLGLRDRAILETLYSTGIRRMELAHLLVFDVDHERGTLMVRQGKGKKDRLIPIGERALAWIAKYLADVRPSLAVAPDPQHLFLGSWGEPLTLQWLTDRVRDYISRANLGKTGSCHLFRHTMATLMLEGGADIRHVQEMLGHADIKTTQVYTQVSIQKLKAIHSATHPAAKLERHEHDPEADSASAEVTR
jgi:integrase/recombinase XerD